MITSPWRLLSTGLLFHPHHQNCLGNAGDKPHRAYIPASQSHQNSKSLWISQISIFAPTDQSIFCHLTTHWPGFASGKFSSQLSGTSSPLSAKSLTVWHLNDPFIFLLWVKPGPDQGQLSPTELYKARWLQPLHQTAPFPPPTSPLSPWYPVLCILGPGGTVFATPPSRSCLQKPDLSPSFLKEFSPWVIATPSNAILNYSTAFMQGPSNTTFQYHVLYVSKVLVL